MQNNKKQGLVTNLYESDKVKSTTNYKDGKLHVVKTNWGKDGQKSSEVTWEKGWKYKEKKYKNGKKHWVDTGWYENGQKTSEVTWKDNNLHGMNVWWYENGMKEKEQYYFHAEVRGTIFWDEEGNVYRTELPTQHNPSTSSTKTNQKPRKQPRYAKP